MAKAIALRADHGADDLRRLARTSRDAAQTRRLLALAAIHDGASRTEAEPARSSGTSAAPKATPDPLRLPLDRHRSFNALAETVIGFFKTEVIRRRGPWRGLEAVEFATLEWVDWFTHRRLLGPIGHVPPAEAKARHHEQLEVAAMAAWAPNEIASGKPGAVQTPSFKPASKSALERGFSTVSPALLTFRPRAANGRHPAWTCLPPAPWPGTR